MLNRPNSSASVTAPTSGRALSTTPNAIKMTPDFLIITPARGPGHKNAPCSPDPCGCQVRPYSPAFTSAMKVCHPDASMVWTGPSGSLLSPTATTRGKLCATSTNCRRRCRCSWPCASGILPGLPLLCRLRDEGPAGHARQRRLLRLQGPRLGLHGDRPADRLAGGDRQALLAGADGELATAWRWPPAPRPAPGPARRREWPRKTRYRSTAHSRSRYRERPAG